MPDRDRFEAFVEYQTRLLAQFEAMAEECNFHHIDAAGSIRQVFQTQKAQTKRVLVNMKPIPPDEAKEVLVKVVAAEKDASRKTEIERP